MAHTERQSIYGEVTSRIIAELEAGRLLRKEGKGA